MSKIETSLLTDQVYQLLRTRIIDGQYLPGERLDIHKLSDEFGVSRSPVKAAIDQLVHDHLIEIIPRQGTYVTEVDLTSFLETLDARLMVETWAAKQIINNLSEDKLKEWKQIVEDMEKVLNTEPFTFEKYNELDMTFHHNLVAETHNQTILDLFASFNTHIALSRIVRSTSLTSTLKRHQDHWDLYHALKNKDFNAFLEAITSHIKSLQEESVRIFEDVQGKNT